MRYLRRMISVLLVLCMVASVIPPVSAAETDTMEGRILLDEAVLAGQETVWVDGVEYTVQESGGSRYVDLPEGTEAGNLVTYTYHIGNPEDVHSQYPLGMQVWELAENEDGSYTPEQVEELDNILQYSGSSIRITGNKGIRMITSIEKNKKHDLVSGGLGGYELLEYGTVLSWASDLAGGNPLVLGPDYAKHNYAYKKGVADPVFDYAGDLMQYTNVLVGFTLDECKDDIAMRPYMILENEDGEQMTVYGGIVHRSIGYIAWQNRYVFTPGSAAYEYVWEIIRHVYGDISEIIFQTNGGSVIEPVILENGTALQKPADPVNGDLFFGGWYTDAGLTQKYDFSQPVTKCMTLYARWTDGPVMPENPSEADEYYFSTSEVIEVIPVEESEDVPTEAEVINLLKERGFDDYPVTYEFTINGEYVDETEAAEGAASKHPMYYTFYISANREVWLIYVVNGMVMASPVSFNLTSALGVEVLVSESEALTGYDDVSNQFYINIPYESTAIVKRVDKINAETLDRLTVEEIN